VENDWVFNMADLIGGHLAPLERCIYTVFSVGQPINQEELVFNLLKKGQTVCVAYKKL